MCVCDKTDSQTDCNPLFLLLVGHLQPVKDQKATFVVFPYGLRGD